MAHVSIDERPDPRRICIIKPSAFGCVVQALPVISAVRRRYPRADISWVIRKDLLDLVAGHPELNECITFSRHGGVRAFLRLLRTIRSRRFDLLIDLQCLARSGLMALASGAPVRMGLTSAREGASVAYNVVVPDTGRDVPACDRYLRVARLLGVSTANCGAHVAVPPSDREWAGSILRSLPRPIVAVHAGAIWNTKRCPPQLFATVLKRTLTGNRGSVVFIGAGSDTAAAAAIHESLCHDPNSRPDSVDLTGATTLKQLAAVLSEVDVLLCNDSGPMHLAAAMSTPVVGMFTCTDPVLSGPPEPRHRLFVADVPCAGGYHKACPLRGELHLRCHKAIPVERISRALAQVLRLDEGTPAQKPCTVLHAVS